MKKHVVILIFSITASLFTFTSCGKTTGAEEQSSVVTTEATPTTSTESVVYTPDPTTTPTPTPTPNAPPDPTSTPDPTASPDPTSTPNMSGYYVEDDTRAYLKGLGAIDEEIDNIKSDEDLAALITKLYKASTGNSSTTGGSSSTDTGPSGATGEDVHDPSMENHLGSGDTVQGSM